MAYFSSAGNVSPTFEGQFGRFKPDVVAPGVFIVSDRSTNYIDPTLQQSVNFADFPGNTLQPNQQDDFTIIIPSDTQFAFFQILPNALSISPFPTNLFITAGPTNDPTLIHGQSPLFWDGSPADATNFWTVTVKAEPPLTQPLNFDLFIYVVQTNFLCNYFTVLSNLNEPLKPFYRYESGTSMSTAGDGGSIGSA